MKRVLVVTSVHPPDDPRIRRKLIGSLGDAAAVRYAVRAPGPTVTDGLTVEMLRGGRIRRTVRASWLIVRGRYDVASVHDPELLPAAIVAGLLRRRVVFDLHEDLVAQMATKRVIPGPLRRVAAVVAAALLRLAERTVEVTLAEAGYQRRFATPRPVFPNYLAGVDVAAVPAAERSGVVYLGDVTRDRGADVVLDAVGSLEPSPPLTMIGRCAPDLRKQLEVRAAARGIDLRLTGFLDHAEALPLVARHAVAVSPLRDIPNYRDSQPTKLLEYLALGVPVVASDLPGSRALVGDAAAAVWAPPGDAAALAAGIRRVLDDPALTRAAREAAPDVARRYRWPAADVRNLYLTAAGTTP